MSNYGYSAMRDGLVTAFKLLAVFAAIGVVSLGVFAWQACSTWSVSIDVERKEGE